MKSALPIRLPTAWRGVLCAAVLGATFVLSFEARAQEPPNVARAKQLMRKAQSGDQPTPDEKAFLDRVREDVRRRAAAKGDLGSPPVARPSSAGAPSDDRWETLSDGSMGQVTKFHGVGGVEIPAYVRKPKGGGPFPLIVLLHGGKYGAAATMGLGRSTQSPVADFLKAGWAVYSIDYRPSEKIAIVPIEFDDSVEAVKTARKLPFVDPRRVGLLGGSHGAQVSSRVVSRIDVSGAALCAPAAIDLIEVKKAARRGEPVVAILKKMIADMETERGARAEEIAQEPGKYGYSSAMTEVADVRAPILVVNGRNDDNSPTSVIDAYVARLKAAGKPVETYLPENGPHGFYFGRPDIPETKEAARRMVAFFQQRFAQAAGTTPSPAAADAFAKTPARYDYGPMEWVDPDRTEPEGMKYRTFHSKTIDREVSYLVYLPPDYEADATARYPVLYSLPASGGTPRGGGEVARRLDAAIRAGRAAPMIIVSVNGLRGNTMYCDSRDGLYPLETVLIHDLIPHVDSVYRTQASRERRAVEGFSMGGFGAAHLGFKYPEVFGVVSIQAPALLGPELEQPRPKQAWSRLFPNALGGDLEYWRANDPFSLAETNADALRDRTRIRIICHIEDENWLAPQCERLHQLLMRNTIPHAFFYLSNVKSHNRAQVLDTLGDSGFDYFSSSLHGGGTAPTAAAGAGAPVDAPIDVGRGRALVEKSRRGEPLSPEDHAYLERVKAEIRQRRAGGRLQDAPRPTAPRPSPPVNPEDWKELVPITEMIKPYKGEGGGLYGEGQNEPPEAHRRAHLKESEGVVPRDANGRPADDGKIGLISIGFSNPSIEWEAFKRTADADPQKSPHVVIVNGCMGGRSAAMWAWDGADILPQPEQERLDKEMDLLGMPKENRRTSLGVARDTWPTLARRIEAAGLSPAQVQACWLKHVEANPAPLGEFPAHARALQADITDILNIAKHHYPNLRVVYLSSRTFGGWSGRASGSPEPYAYESGFGTRWVVQGQIKGDPQLNFDPGRGPVRAPFVLWGPYLWAQGDTPRKLDGLTWTQADVRADHLHPSEAGSKRTTTLLLNFFKMNEGTSRWFLKPDEEVQPAPLPK